MYYLLIYRGSILKILCLICFISISLSGAYARISLSPDDTAKAFNQFASAQKLFSNQNFIGAAENYIKAADIYKTNKAWNRCVVSLVEAGFSYRKSGQFEKAIDLYTQAEEIAKEYLKNGNDLISLLYYRRAIVYSQQAKAQNAILDYSSAIKYRKLLNYPKDEILAKSYSNLGSSYFYLGEYDKAIENFKHALILDQVIGNQKEISSDLNNIGSITYLYGQYDQALDYFKQAKKLNEQNAGKNNLYVNYNNIANVYSELGKYYEALDWYKQVLNQIELVKSKPNIATLENNLGSIYERLGQDTIALKYFDKAYNIYFEKKDLTGMALSLGNMGFIFSKMNNFDKALELSKKALELNEVAGFQDLTDNYNNIGKIYFQQGIYESAYEYFNKALNYAEKIRNKPNIAFCYANIGSVLRKQGKNTEALNLYQKALQVLIPSFKYSDIFTNPDIQNSISDMQLLNILKAKAETFKELSEKDPSNIKYLEASIASFNKTIELIDKIRTGFASWDSKLYFASNEKSTYSSSIENTLELYNKTGKKELLGNIFQYAEKGKAALLYELIRENDAKKYAGIEDTLILKEKLLKNNISFYKKAIYEEKQLRYPDTAKISLWENKVFVLSNDLDKLIDRLEKDYPKYFQFKYDNKIFNPSEVQQSLGKDDALLEFFLTEKVLYTFCITKSGFDIKKADINNKFYDLVEKLRNSLSKSDPGQDAQKRFNDYTSSAFELYRLIILPFSKSIEGRNLIIIPDGVLGYIPFEALLTKQVSTAKLSYKQLPYLLNDFSVSYGYSSTLLINSKNNKRRAARQNYSGFAPCYNKKISFDEKVFAGLHKKFKEFEALTGTKNEIDQAKKMVGGKVFLDSVATEERFKDVAGKYKILHIATHGVIDDKNPMYSKLLFYNNGDTIEDGFLNTYELFNMELHADMAVLSACNTGYGKDFNGEGIMTIARGFLYAGVPSVMMSLWQINDESSSIIMEKFYYYLKENMPKDQALRKAKLDYIDRSDGITADPYFWAGFIHIGDQAPIRFVTNRWMIILILIGLLSASGLIWFLRKRK
jgi:CHAT domain-containing protein/tetratricopeptide (TPR) repeat protein